MAIIGNLVVTLGLNPAQFTAGQRAAVAAANQAVHQLQQQANLLQQQAARVNASFATMRRHALEFIAAAVGARGLKDFVENTISGDAALGRFARTVGASADLISKWQGAAALMGSSAEELATSWAGLQNQLISFKRGEGGQIAALLTQIGTEGGVAFDQMHDSIETMIKKLAINLKNIEDKGKAAGQPGQGGWFGQKLGIGPNFLAGLLKGGPALEEFLRIVASIGTATEQDTKNAEEMLQKWRELGLAITNAGRVLMTEFGEPIKALLNELTGKIKGRGFIMKFLFGEDERIPDFVSRILPKIIRGEDVHAPGPYRPGAGVPDLERRLRGRGTGAISGGRIGEAFDALGATQAPTIFRPTGGSRLSTFNNAGNTTTTEISVNGPVSVNTQATDAAGVARDFKAELEALGRRRLEAAQGLSGAQ